MKKILRKILRNTPIYGLIEKFRAVPLPERILNWFIQRVIYKTKGLIFSLHFTSRATCANKLIIGKGVEKSLGRNGGCYLSAINGIEIGDYTIIAAGVKIISANHEFSNYARYGKEYSKAPPIRIGKRCWLGANCVILPGVELGDEVIVGAGAVVTKSFPAYSTVGGVPAKLIEKSISD